MSSSSQHPTPSVQPIHDERLPRHPSQSPLDEACITTLRTLAMDAIQKAKSGHPGMPMGMAPAAYLLWTEAIKWALGLTTADITPRPLPTP